MLNKEAFALEDGVRHNNCARGELLMKRHF